MCLDGFTPINNKCLKLINSDHTRDDVRRQCNLYGGNLVSIHNSIDNTAVAQFAFSNSDPIWIGTKCTINKAPYSCPWDDEQSNATAYNNFIPGNPSVDIGQCVYMLTTGSLRGKWLSGQCNSMELSAVCETEPVAQCNNFYRGYCYSPLGELTASEAEYACSQYCKGNLASIHSEDENDYILAFFRDRSKNDVRIGAKQSSGSNSWIDGSAWNFSYIGDQSSAMGLCYSMSMIDDLVYPGKWISSEYNDQIPSICKWSPSSTCGTPTLAPAQCGSPVYFTNTGNLYSPAYPYSYTSTDTSPCYYVMTTSSSQANLYFDEFDLDPSSSIDFFSSLTDLAPFLTINQTTTDIVNTAIWSTTNLMRMVFNPCTQDCDQSKIYRWSAKFGQVPF